VLAEQSHEQPIEALRLDSIPPRKPVAMELREVTGGGKPYRWHEGHRRRVYYI
jgi:hypothetical protein